MSAIVENAVAIATLVGLPLTAASVICARPAATSSRRSLQLQEAETARRAEFERPGLGAEYEIEKGQRRVSVIHARPAPYPYWDIVGVEALQPSIAMLRRSEDGLPVGEVVGRIAIQDRLGFDPRGGPAPSDRRFFIAWGVGSGDGLPARVRLRLARQNGETQEQDFEVLRP